MKVLGEIKLDTSRSVAKLGEVLKTKLKLQASIDEMKQVPVS
jgi:hypothetical protein